MDFSDELTEIIAEPDAEYIYVGDRRLMEENPGNTETTLVYGRLPGQSKPVIKSIMVPSIYTQENRDRYVKNIRKNNLEGNCPMCSRMEEKLRNLSVKS